MPKEAAEVGQHFRWTSASEHSSSGTAVPRRVLADREEGLGEAFHIWHVIGIAPDDDALPSCFMLCQYDWL